MPRTQPDRIDTPDIGWAVRRAAMACVLVSMLGGCATYHERPLGTASTLPDRIPHVVIDPRAVPLPMRASAWHSRFS
jgi:hypothetical protein